MAPVSNWPEKKRPLPAFVGRGPMQPLAHRRLGYPSAGCTSAEPASVSPSGCTTARHEAVDQRSTPAISSLTHPRVHGIGARSAARAWAAELVSDDRALLRLLPCFLRFSSVSTMGDYVGRAEPFMWMSEIRSLGLDPGALRGRVAALAQSAEGREKLAAETFVKEVDNPRCEPRSDAADSDSASAGKGGE